ncbi:MAG TPA: hypothetical protein VHM90_16855 [Phycisphaerae bacterium]|nr:hypothetical protein [Phycisphaerae bacterium]
MPIRKQEFYEGAALHQLARSGAITSIQLEPPFFLINDYLSVCMKYCTRGRTPWGFTVLPDELSLFQVRAAASELLLALICGSDGIAVIGFSDYLGIAGRRTSAVHISCSRPFGHHYAVSGPEVSGEPMAEGKRR